MPLIFSVLYFCRVSLYSAADLSEGNLATNFYKSHAFSDSNVSVYWKGKSENNLANDTDNALLQHVT